MLHNVKTTKCPTRCARGYKGQKSHPARRACKMILQAFRSKHDDRKPLGYSLLGLRTFGATVLRGLWISPKGYTAPFGESVYFGNLRKHAGVYWVNVFFSDGLNIAVPYSEITAL